MNARMTVLIASAPRSGGTWLFNATRLVLALHGEVHGAWIADYLPDHSADYHVVKAHDPRQVRFEPSLVLTTHRDIYERLASLIRMGWLKAAPDTILAAYKQQTQLYDDWKSRSDLEIDYADIVNVPERAVRAIAAALRVEISDAESLELADQLRALETPSEGSYDRLTLLHKGHRDESNFTVLAADQLRSIIAKAG